MNRLQQAKSNQILFRLPCQRKGEDDVRFTERIYRAVQERMITEDILKSRIALARLSGTIKKR